MKNYRKTNGQFGKDPRLPQMFIGCVFVIGMFFIGIAGSKAMYQKIIRSVGATINVQNAQAEEVAIQFKAPTLWDKVGAAAQQYGVNAYKVYRTLQCESKMQAKQSDYIKNGVRENSWGIAQINLTYHPEVTKAQAMDEDFAIQWTAKNFNKVTWYAYDRRLDTCN